MKRVFAHIGFSCAVSLLVLNVVSVSLLPLITVGVAVVFITSLLLPAFRKTMAVPLCFGAALFSCILFLTVYYSAVAPAMLLHGCEADALFYITNVSKKDESSFVYTATAVRILKNGAPQNIKIRITSDRELYAEAYQLVNAKMKYYTLRKSAFSSYGYWGKGIYLNSRITSYETTDKIVNIPMHYLYNLRRDIIYTLYTNVRGDEGALSAALITGDKTLLSDKAYSDFKIAGVSHLMAVSGLHLTVVTGALYFVLRKLRVGKRATAVCLMVVTLLFSAMTGFSISIVRAGIMLCVMLIASLFSMRSDTLNSLGIAVFIICLNPFAVTDVGAVLSVLSVLALINAPRLSSKVKDKLNNRFRHRSRAFDFALNAVNYISESLIASAVVLVFNLPALYLFFGYFSVFAVVLNIIIVPLGSLSTLLSFVTFGANKLSIFENLFNSFDRIVNGLILKLVSLANEFDFSLLRTGKYFGVVLAAILIIFALAFIFDNKRFMKFAAVTAVIAVCLTSVFSYYTEKKNVEVLLLEDGAFAAVSSGEAIVNGVKSKSDYYTVSSFLKARRASIDTMITDVKYSEYAVMLSEKFECREIVSEAFSPELLNADSETYTVDSARKGKSGKDISFDFAKMKSFKLFSLNVRDTNFSFSKNTGSKNRIYVESEKVYDYNGIIDMRKGAVLYTVYDNNIYEARRLNVWES